MSVEYELKYNTYASADCERSGNLFNASFLPEISSFRQKGVSRLGLAVQFFLLAPQFEQNVAVCTISPPQYWHGIITTSLVITSF
jgi:hypothetical protein